MGQKFAAYNTQGQIVAYYDSIDSPAPSGVQVLNITEAQWQQCIEQPGWAVANGALVAPAPPTSAQLLAQAQAAQIGALKQAYSAAIQAPVSYTSKGGITKTYQADPQSVSNLQNAILGMQAAGATPSGFYWVAADNTQVPFTFADLQALAAAFLAQGWASFQKLQNLKVEVMAATSVSAVQAIVW